MFTIILQLLKLAPCETGYLTLPQEEIGLAFIQRYQPGATAQLTVNARQIVVTPSNKPLQRDIVERLRRTKYRDPRSEAEKRLAERALELSVGTPLLKIEQGWTKRDSTFVSEYGIQINNNIKVNTHIRVSGFEPYMTYHSPPGTRIAV